MPGQRRLLIAKVTERVSLGLIPVLSAIRANYPNLGHHPENLLDFLHQALLDWFAACVGVLGLLGLVANLAQERLNPETKARLRGALDSLLDTYFTDVPEDERYHNRATLFKANRSRTLLKPYCRSGTQYQRGIQTFEINDNDEGRNEGIAGQAWFRNATVYVGNLPECPNPWSDTDNACRRYAVMSLLPLEKAARLHVKSRSILATAVRDLKGTKWGVLVVDGRKPDAVQRDAAKDQLVTSFAATLGKML